MSLGINFLTSQLDQWSILDLENLQQLVADQIQVKERKMEQELSQQYGKWFVSHVGVKKLEQLCSIALRKTLRLTVSCGSKVENFSKNIFQKLLL